MTLSFRIVAALLGAAMATAVSAQATAVYKWTDDKGVVQYTDAPPEGRKFEKMEVGGSGKARAAEEAAATETSSDAAAPAEATPAQRRLDVMKANCQTARTNLETLRSGEEVTADMDGDGNPETLDAEGRNKASAAAEETVRQNCVE